jgi:hypothetical protein
MEHIESLQSSKRRIYPTPKTVQPVLSSSHRTQVHSINRSIQHGNASTVHRAFFFCIAWLALLSFAPLFAWTQKEMVHINVADNSRASQAMQNNGSAANGRSSDSYLRRGSSAVATTSRVAVCFSGQMRTLETTVGNTRTHFLSQLEDQLGKVDVFAIVSDCSDMPSVRRLLKPLLIQCKPASLPAMQLRQCRGKPVQYQKMVALSPELNGSSARVRPVRADAAASVK